MAAILVCSLAQANAQQPAEPVDPSPINGETYYFLNQLSALQIDLQTGSNAVPAPVIQNTWSFTSLTQRWATTKVPSGNWKISNLQTGLCLDAVQTGTTTSIVQNTCTAATPSQEWSFTYISNGYNAVVNAKSGTGLDLAGASPGAGAGLTLSPLGAAPTQSQQWLFRPVFFRGNDNAIQEKQEALRVAGSYPWWQDAGQPQDVLQILKNHGFNMVRIRPTSVPPYTTYTLGSSPATPATCSGNGCYAETDAASLDLAKRARQMGMSVELSLFFDGGSSSASPGAWSGYTVAQTQTAIYNYTKAQVEAYRAAGVMPDMVSIGNEVDTGFLASLKGSPSGSATSTAFKNFSAFEASGMQAVADAAADTALGPALPTPLRCIHITPAWDLTSFFSEVNANNVPYDALCQSYYPIFHGPLTQAQATASNPYSKPVEQAALMNAATSIGKPIFLIEVAEHYENGFDANDPWYTPSLAGQRQFILDLQSVLKAVPGNLAMGFEYWDGEGTNIPNRNGYTAGDGSTDATFVWNGLTLFDNGDSSGSTSVSAPLYNEVLPALSAVGGKLDPTLTYKLVNASDGRILETVAASTASGAALDTASDSGITSLHQQWQIRSNGDGFFGIANANAGATANVLDTNGVTSDGSPVVQMAAAAGSAGQEWDIITAANGYFTLVNKASSLLLGAVANGTADTVGQGTPAATNADWITPKNKGQMWQIVPVHISASSVPQVLVFDAANATTVAAGGTASISVDVQNAAGALIGSPSVPVTLTITGPASFTQTMTANSANGAAVFNVTGLAAAGAYALAASSTGLTGATASLQAVTASTRTVLTASATTVTSGGSVTLTAIVTQTNGTANPGGAVTFYDGATALNTATLSAGSASFSTSALGTGAHMLTAAYAGDALNAASTSAAVTVTVNVPPDFAVTVSPASATLANGSSVSASVSIASTGGFNAAVTLSCSGLPAYTTCSFSPASVTPSGTTAASSTMTIATNVATAALAEPRFLQHPHFVVADSAGLAALLLLGWPAARRRRRGRVLSFALGAVMLSLSLFHLAGCSGGAGQSPSNPVRTPAGSSTVTVSAVSGATTHTASFQLTIQ